MDSNPTTPLKVDTDVSIQRSVGPQSPTAASPSACPDDVSMTSSPLRAGAPTSRHQVIIALDNDECVGSWGDLSLLYTVYTHVLHIEPPLKLFAELLTATGCARPGLREMYDEIARLKAAGQVAKVAMVTAARDTVGWVSFLRRVLEAWYGAPVYDFVIEGSQLLEWNAKHSVPVLPTGCAIYKDMDHVRSVAGMPDASVFMIDDRPENIVNGTTHGVVPYSVAVNLVAVAQTYVPEYTADLHQRYAATLSETWQQFQRDPSHFTVAWRDTALKEATTSLTTYVDAVTREPKSAVAAPLPLADESSDVTSCRRSASRSGSVASVPEFCETPRATAA